MLRYTFVCAFCVKTMLCRDPNKGSHGLIKNLRVFRNPEFTTILRNFLRQTVSFPSLEGIGSLESIETPDCSKQHHLVAFEAHARSANFHYIESILHSALCIAKARSKLAHVPLQCASANLQRNALKPSSLKIRSICSLALGTRRSCFLRQNFFNILKSFCSSFETRNRIQRWPPITQHL